MENRQLTVEQFKYMEDKVLEWNTVFGNNLDDGSLISTYVKLCIEEGNEYVNAPQKAVELFKVKYGRMPSKSEEDQTELLTIGHCECIDALGDSVFTGFMLNRLKTEDTYDDWFEEFVTSPLIITSFDELVHLLKKGELYTYTTYLTYQLLEDSERYNIFGAFQRICESNFSKAATKDVDIEKEIAYIESQGRYVDVFAEESGDYIIFKARKDLVEGNTFEKGKIVKPSTFVSVEDLGGLEEFIY
ncbi:hypothetical protein NVP1084O_075 [Vibrio phage 1.084.O._10N.261.49.F5]|nr:hypothetical protein NVP1084O_075 [Vibrio phage 1.084.O._10N.261.49.F5]